MKKNYTIHFIITGGTIDSEYDGSRDTAVPSKESVIPSFIRGLKLYDKSEFTTVCMKDSRALKRKDLLSIRNAIEKSKHKNILITHGTYTMPDTARFLVANLKRKDQVIVLTSSIIPIKGFSPSDGPFNLGYAISKLQDLSAGIYVAVNGRVFSPEEVIKVISEARFSSIFNK